MLKNYERIEQLTLDLDGIDGHDDNGAMKMIYLNAIVNWIEQLECKYMDRYRKIENLIIGDISLSTIDQYNDEVMELRNMMTLIEIIISEKITQLDEHVEVLRLDDHDGYPTRQLRSQLTIEIFEDSIDKVERIYERIIALPI